MTVELDQAISIAHAFFLGDDPSRWSDCEIVSTANSVAEASGVDTDEIKGFLFAERDAKAVGRGKVAPNH